MPRKKRSEEMLAEVRRDRLNKHLTEVEQYIREWISELATPSPFIWSESEEAVEFESNQASMPVRLPMPEAAPLRALSPWKQWARRSVYAPLMEQTPITNHMLRKHLRKRSLWASHTVWEQRLKTVKEMASPVYNKAAQIVDIYRGQWQITEDYEGTALERAFDLSLELGTEKSYEQKSAFSRGVWYGGILIEKSAKPEEVEAAAEQHRGVIKELAKLEEMLSLTGEWRKVLEIQTKMQEIATRALIASDILYACQFCRRLW